MVYTRFNDMFFFTLNKHLIYSNVNKMNNLIIYLVRTSTNPLIFLLLVNKSILSLQ